MPAAINRTLTTPTDGADAITIPQAGDGLIGANAEWSEASAG
jgi:hypothetical protein